MMSQPIATAPGAAAPRPQLATEADNNLAREIQRCVPLVRAPFSVIGDQLGLAEDEVIAKLQAWRDGGLLREISAVLEGSAIGHESALVAGRIDPADLDRVAAVVNEHPTVTHNYERDHAYNLWLTIAAPSEIGLQRMVEALAKAAAVERFEILRRTLTFKVGVNFDLVTRKSRTEVLPLSPPVPVDVSPQARAMFRALQTTLPLVPRPFRELATLAGTTEDELLAFAREAHGNALRRYVATFHHRRLGVRGNGMVVWNVPEDQLAALGAVVAESPEVSHCYARNGIEGFPYRLYSMIHGPDEAACREVAARLAQRIGIDDYLILFSSREFKKCRLRYFLPELDAWWHTHGA